jgi:glycosyltransferase involved in cell wall biosynthesis
LHVLVIPSWYPETPVDISGSFFREQATALVKAHCKVGVIYPQRRSIRNWYRGAYGLDEQDEDGVSVLRWYGIKWLSLFSGGNALLWLRDGIRIYKRYVKRHGVPDIIHAHSAIYGGVLAQRIRQRFGVPYVITEHSSVYVRNMLDDRQRKLAGDAVRLASRRFAVSESLCALLEKYFGMGAGSWETLPNMVNHMFAEYPLQGPVRKSDGFVFVSITALKNNKGVDDLINAFARAFTHKKEVRLVIGGDGAERANLQALVKRLGLESRVRFLGALSRRQVLETVSVADAFVSSSHYETFGVAVVEALALGKPVIVTRCGGPESIVQERDGMLVPTSDVDSLAEAMKVMRNNIEKYDASEIRQACLCRYSEAAVTARLISCYENLPGTRQSVPERRV